MNSVTPRLAETILAAFRTAGQERAIGCCRVYVTVEKQHAKTVAAAAKQIGKIFEAKAHYGMRNALYIGYDNCSGRELAQGAAVVSALKAVGIDAYREEHGD